MSMTVRSREADSHGAPLAPRVVRVRNVLLRAIARKRGLQEPAHPDLAHLDADVTLSAAVAWWEGVQRDKRTAPADVDAGSVVSVRRSNVMVKAAAISVLVVIALLAFPREAAGEWLSL